MGIYKCVKHEADLEDGGAKMLCKTTEDKDSVNPSFPAWKRTGKEKGCEDVPKSCFYFAPIGRPKVQMK